MAEIFLITQIILTKTHYSGDVFTNYNNKTIEIRNEDYLKLILQYGDYKKIFYGYSRSYGDYNDEETFLEHSDVDPVRWFNGIFLGKDGTVIIRKIN